MRKRLLFFKNIPVNLIIYVSTNVAFFILIQPKKESGRIVPSISSKQSVGGKIAFLLANTMSIKNGFFIKKTKPRENKKKQNVQTHGHGLRKGWTEDMDLNFCYFGLFWFCHGFCSLAKTTRKPKNKKIRPMDRVWGEAWQGHGSELFVCFLFSHGFFCSLAWGRRCANCRNAHFLRGTVFLFSDLLSSNLSVLSASALLCFSSVHIVGSLTSKLPSIKINT